MHHWTVHAKVPFQKFPPDVRLGGVHFTIFDPDPRNALKKFSNPEWAHSITSDPELKM